VGSRRSIVGYRWDGHVDGPVDLQRESTWLSRRESTAARQRLNIKRRTARIVWGSRSSAIAATLHDDLEGCGRVLDIGAGSCLIANELMKMGHDVTCADIADHSVVPEIVPVIVSGSPLPFADDSFDAVLLCTVLHHVEDHVALLAEARRLSSTVIIIEDLVTGPLQRRATQLMDSFTNLEFRDHPHSNRTDASWRELFESLHLDLTRSSSKRFWGLFTSVTYVLRRAERSAT
jgi:SAM-dependent methyltransferase